jgi:hypothetical protein
MQLSLPWLTPSTARQTGAGEIRIDGGGGQDGMGGGDSASKDEEDNDNAQQLHKYKNLITLAVRGLEEPFFQLCGCVSVFWFWREIGFGVTYILREQYSCGVVLVFWFWQEIVSGFAYVLSVQYSCVVVSVFWLWREIDLKLRTPFDFL